MLTRTYLGYTIFPESGVVLGLLGKPIRKIGARGYIMACTHEGKFSKVAHRMVWESVHGPIPDGMQINHINGIKTDNRLVNLELVTPRQNNLHAYRIGLKNAIGERNGRARLSAEDVQEIRRSSLSCAKLARRYNVSPSTVRDARSGKRWSHLP